MKIRIDAATYAHIRAFVRTDENDRTKHNVFYQWDAHRSVPMKPWENIHAYGNKSPVKNTPPIVTSNPLPSGPLLIGGPEMEMYKALNNEIAAQLDEIEKTPALHAEVTRKALNAIKREEEKTK